MLRAVGYDVPPSEYEGLMNPESNDYGSHLKTGFQDLQDLRDILLIL